MRWMPCLVKAPLPPPPVPMDTGTYGARGVLLRLAAGPSGSVHIRPASTQKRSTSGKKRGTVRAGSRAHHWSKGRTTLSYKCRQRDHLECAALNCQDACHAAEAVWT